MAGLTERHILHAIPFLGGETQVSMGKGRPGDIKWPLLKLQGAQLPFPISESEKANCFLLALC